jgi:hypothetical protein
MSENTSGIAVSEAWGQLRRPVGRECQLMEGVAGGLVKAQQTKMT